MISRRRKKIPRIINTFFDFYCLYELWYKTVGGQFYKNAVPQILPWRKEEIIDKAFTDLVNSLKRLVIENLQRTVTLEAKHYNSYGPCNTHTYAIFRQHPHDLGLISKMFYEKNWSSEYGGKKWGIATDALIGLIQSRSIKDDVYWIDRIFDLQHNNGFILNKTIFKALEDCKGYLNNDCPLDYRAGCVDIKEEMVPYTSFGVYKIMMANANYL